MPGTGIVSPEINADNTVTFRYYNPKAITVEVSGDFLPTERITFTMDGRQRSIDAPGRAALTEQNGLWSYTTAPLEGELYSYTLYVDGQKMMDPSNIYQNRDIATWTNIFTISAEEGDKWLKEEFIPAWTSFDGCTRCVSSKIKKEVNNCPAGLRHCVPCLCKAFSRRCFFIYNRRWRKLR